MKRLSLNHLILCVRICIAVAVTAIISLFLFSFSISKLNEDFLKQLGISRTDADRKISNSILGGYLDAYGIRNVKNLASGNRTAVAKDLLAYTKQYVNSEAFKKEYASMKENNKPRPIEKAETPEEMRTNMIKRAKENVKSAEETVKRSTPEYKKIFEDNLEYAKKNLKEAEDPNNKQVKLYAQNYPALVKSQQQSDDAAIKDWEVKYPSNHLLFVKTRLQQFLEETKDIDFSAQLTEKNGKKYFINKAYEYKGSRWKMAYRAGKEVTETSRQFVQQWITEIH